jgi:hypothetical protein
VRGDLAVKRRYDAWNRGDTQTARSLDGDWSFSEAALTPNFMIDMQPHRVADAIAYVSEIFTRK